VYANLRCHDLGMDETDVTNAIERYGQATTAARLERDAAIALAHDRGMKQAQLVKLTGMTRENVARICQPMIYAVKLPLGDWAGQPDALPEGAYKVGTLKFNPANRELPLAGYDLVVRYGRILDRVPVGFSLYAYSVDGHRIRASQEVHDALFSE